MEIIDLYLPRHEVSGKTTARGECIPEGYAGMIVFICVFNSKGQMLIQQRHPQKSWGGRWDVSAGGVVRSGEATDQAASRELSEELGICLPSLQMTKVLSIYYQGYIHEIFTVHTDIDTTQLKLQEEEVSDVKWVDAAQLHEMIRSGEFLSVYPEFIDLLFRMQTKQGILGD